jgi:dipeptidyl aminopeptidase/acylaminoacyl peptidase
MRQGALWATRVDASTFEPVGDAAPIIEGVRVEAGGAVQFAVSASGTLIYLPETGSQTRRLQWVIDGKPAPPIDGVPQDFVSLALSPDNRRAAVQLGAGEISEIWVADLERGTLTRLTNQAGADRAPLWTPDGSAVVYAAARSGRWELRRKSARTNKSLVLRDGIPTEHQGVWIFLDGYTQFQDYVRRRASVQ